MYSSFCTFLTVKDDQDKHKVFFRNIREVEISYPNSIAHWYSVGVQLHHTDHIYGWSCIGTSSQIEEIFTNINTKSEVKIKGKNFFINNFLTPEKIEIVKGENSLDDIPGIFEKYQTTITSIKESSWFHEVGSYCPALLEDTFCNHISGIKESGHLYKVITPSGFWGEGELIGYLKQSIIDVTERITPYIDFRGTGELKNKNLTGFKGLCHYFPKEWSEVQLCFYDIDKTELLYEKNINLIKGWAEWEVTFAEAPGKGIIEVFNEGNSIGASKYYLLLDINIDIKPVGRGPLFQDTYGRKLSTEKIQPKDPLVKSLNWNSDYSIKPHLLSDDLVQVFSHMGDSILIQDPFLAGGFSEGEKITNGTQSFFNALVTTIVNYNLKHVSLLIDPKKLKLREDDKNRFRGYIKKIFENLKLYGLQSITIAYAKNSFHDRYYLSLSESSLLYHISKSINGYLESEDFNIYLYDGDSKKALMAQIHYRLQTAEKEKIIE